MNKNLNIDLVEIRKIIESDWDDKAIRLKIGEYVVKRASEENKDIASLMDIKFVKDADKASDELRGIRSRCCRGHM